jgi:hypothetical protein
MSERKNRLRDTIMADHRASMEILRAITDEQWHQPVPSEADAPWLARDVLAHLAVSEGGQLGQITRCIAGQVTVPDDFDLQRFNRRSVYKQAERSVTDMLAEIETDFARVLDTLDALDEAELDKSGRHASGEIMTVERFFYHIAEHRRQHAEELRRALAD